LGESTGWTTDVGILGSCPLCGSDMIEGESIDRHHLVPKSRKGKDAELVHLVCHRKIHSVLSEKQLDASWHTWQRLQEHPDIAQFIIWVRKQFERNPEFIDVHRETAEKKRRRRRA